MASSFNVSRYPSRACLLVAEERQLSSKLQAQKSSFQAWKTVSFGCSLLALFLIAGKWREVSNDLSLLAGIERMLEQQHQSATNNQSEADLSHRPLGDILTMSEEQAAATSAGLAKVHNLETLAELSALSLATNLNGTNDLGSAAISNDDLTTQPVAARNSQNENQSSRARVATPTSNQNTPQTKPAPAATIRDHIHQFLSQEFNANHLLRLEIELFSAEFRSSKLTLLLSLVLVAIYIVSWMLMNLAIKDTRISNDISVRNILLLSIFGAIDIASSVAFIMVRLIMYSVKNNPFATDLLDAVGLKDSPIKLNADQTTAFAALRLIAMRSSAASVDLFVGSLVALVTILRLYAIVRALSYYRRLRRIDNCLDATANSSTSTSRRSSAATTINEPLGLQMPQLNQDNYHPQPHSHQLTKNGLIWSPPARPNSYTMGPSAAFSAGQLMNNSQQQQQQRNDSNNNYAGNGYTNNSLLSPQTNSYINLNPNVVGETSAGPNSEWAEQRSASQQPNRQQAKILLLPNATVRSEQQPLSASQISSDLTFVYPDDHQTLSKTHTSRSAFITNSKGTLGGRQQRRHASVETIRGPPPGTEMLLLQAAPQNHQQNGQPRQLIASRRQRASSSPRLLAPESQPEENKVDLNTRPVAMNKSSNATLSAHGLLRRHQLQQQLDCDSDSAAVLSGATNRLGFSGKSRKSLGSIGVLYQKPLKKSYGTQRSAHVTRSSLQDLILTDLHPEANGQKQQQQQLRTATQLITNPIKAFRTLRSKKSEHVGLVPTMYTVVNPAMTNEPTITNPHKHSQAQTPTLIKTSVNNNQQQQQRQHSTNPQATKYKLVARYRQMGSVDSSLATRTINTTTADSSASCSSISSCGPDDSDNSLAVNDLLISATNINNDASINKSSGSRSKHATSRQRQLVRDAAGMRHSDEFIACSNETGLAIAHSLGGGTLVKQHVVLCNNNDDRDTNGQHQLLQQQQPHIILKAAAKGSHQSSKTTSQQQHTIVMSARDDEDDGDSSDIEAQDDQDTSQVVGGENVLMGKYYYYT